MFSWRKIYAEIVEKLKDYQFRNAELVSLMAEMHQLGLKASTTVDRDESKEEFQLEEIDPFTFLGNFNRGITDANRKAILSFLKDKWKLDADVPGDFDGLPVLASQKSWLMPFKYERTSSHISLLWELFIHCATADDEKSLKVDLFDKCIELHMVGVTYLSIGMFWANPNLWLSADKKNVAQAELLGIGGKPSNGQEYSDWLLELKNKISVEPWEFSHQSHQNPTSNKTSKTKQARLTLAEPYSLLFENAHHANEVFDVFARVLDGIQASEDDSITVVSYQKQGRTGGQIRVICGRWAVFGFRKRTGNAEIQILLPEKDANRVGLNPSYRFSHPKTGEAFVLGWKEEDWLWGNLQAVWPSMKSALETAHTLFKDWKASPYGGSHVEELFAAIRAKDRAKYLATPITLSANSEVAYWLLAPGEGAFMWPEFQQESMGSIGWDALGNLANYESEADLITAAEELCSYSSPNYLAKVVDDFVNNIKPGDVVFAKPGLFKVCGWGIVVGDYFYDETRDAHRNTIPIDWRCTEEVNVRDGMQLPVKTLTQMTGNEEFLDAMANRYVGVPGLGVEIPSPDPTPAAPKEYTKADALDDLFMPEQQLDQIVAQLSRKKNIVLQGAPGTGKTFVARRIAYLLFGEQARDRAPMVQFHQSTSYEDFIQGYRPKEGGFELKNGGFYEFCDKARQQPTRKFVYIIDEINRGNLSKIFGELLMLIECDKRRKEFAIPLTYSRSNRETFYVPENVYLIGTMNTADRSLSMVDYALRRRFSFIELNPGFENPAFAEHLKKKGADPSLVESIKKRMRRLNEIIAEDTIGLGRGYRIGHSFFVPQPGHEANETWLNDVIDFEVIPLLEEYWCDDESKLGEARRILTGDQ